MLRFRVFLALLSAGSSSVVPAQSPSMRIEGRLERANSGQPVTRARVVLIRLTRMGPASDTATAVVGSDGRFAFDSLAAGRYVLQTFAIGFRSRADTVLLTGGPPLRLTIPLLPRPLRLGTVERSMVPRTARSPATYLTILVHIPNVALAPTAPKAKPTKSGDGKPRVLVSFATPLHL